MVKGIVTSLSPARQAERIFLSELSDGKAIILLVGFDRVHCRFLDKHMNSETPIMLHNCQIATIKLLHFHICIVSLKPNPVNVVRAHLTQAHVYCVTVTFVLHTHVLRRVAVWFPLRDISTF